LQVTAVDCSFIGLSISLYEDYIITLLILVANKLERKKMKFSTIDFYKEICDSLILIDERLDSLDSRISKISSKYQQFIKENIPNKEN